MKPLPVLRTFDFRPSTLFADFVESRQGARGTAALESPEGQAAFAGVVEDQAPRLLELAETVRGIVATDAGGVIVQGLGFEHAAAVHGEAMRDALVLALTSAIGEPTDHCADKRVMWPVRNRPVAEGKKATFSESLGEERGHLIFNSGSFQRIPH